MAQVIFNTAINNGTISNITLMKQALNAGDTQSALKYLENIEKANNSIQQRAMNGPAPRRVDPKVSEYEQKLSTLEQQKQEMFLKDVNAANNQWIDQTVRKELKGYLGRDLPNTAYGRLYEAVCEKVRGLLQQNDGFMKRREALMQKGDKEGLLSLWKTSTAKLWSKAVRDTAREFEYNPKAAGKNGAAARPAQQQAPGKDVDAGWEKTTKYPKREDVNDKHPDYYRLAESDKFILKNGKKIQVVPN
jgi:hypothetical protein